VPRQPRLDLGQQPRVRRAKKRHLERRGHSIRSAVTRGVVEGDSVILARRAALVSCAAFGGDSRRHGSDDNHPHAPGRTRIARRFESSDGRPDARHVALDRARAISRRAYHGMPRATRRC
jgi:hypothetical protein